MDGIAGGAPLARVAARLNLDDLLAAGRNVPATELNWAFAALRPLSLLVERYRGIDATLSDPEAREEFLRMERWMYGGPDQALGAFVEFVRALYRDNALIRGMLTLRGRRLSLADIDTPVFAVAAAEDHLVPLASATALGGRTAGSYDEHVLPGGHLGVFISRRAHESLYPRLDRWLEALG
ncbi:MAG: hypothetical protein U5L11_13790 [Arhodomonas sp.]|nr:hypothetical protein [Arhodomonas sp.]